MSLNGETPDDARVIRARLNHNSPPTIELHADNLGQVTSAEKDRPETVIQVAAAPLSEQGVVDHGQQYPAPRNALSCRDPRDQRGASYHRVRCVNPKPPATGEYVDTGGLASAQVASPRAAVRGWGVVARSPEAAMTSTTLLPFQPDAMTPAQLAAVSYLARYTGHTHTLYAYQLRRWFTWCESNDLDPLVGIQRAHIELYIRHLGDGGLRVSSVNTMMHGVRGFFRFAHIDGLIVADPAVYARLPKIHGDESRTQGLNRRELIPFLQVVRTISVHHGALAHCSASTPCGPPRQQPYGSRTTARPCAATEPCT